MSPSIRKQQAKSGEYVTSLLPNAIYDGCGAIHEPSLIECFGGGRLRNIITKKKQYHYE